MEALEDKPLIGERERENSHMNEEIKSHIA